MNGDDCTGQGPSLGSQVAAPVAIEFESVSGDRSAPGLETVGSRSTGASRRRSSDASVSAPLGVPHSIPQRALKKRRLYLQACRDALESLRVVGDDPIHKANALAEIRHQLRSLWELLEGNPDSEPFEEIVNVLQVAFCDSAAESFGPDQLDAISSVLSKLHDDPDLGDQAAKDIALDLMRSGIDVFREIG